MKGYLFDEMTRFFDGGGRNILRGGKWGARGKEAGVKWEPPPQHMQHKLQKRAKILVLLFLKSWLKCEWMKSFTADFHC